MLLVIWGTETAFVPPNHQHVENEKGVGSLNVGKP
jgi:hypothetical protein